MSVVAAPEDRDARAGGRRVAVLGASGGVGRRVVERLLKQGFGVDAQTRDARRLAGLGGRAEVWAFDPGDASAMTRFVANAQAVVFALGFAGRGPTTFFSETTKTLIDAMRAAGVRRLVAVTGVGAGETRGHGGFVYDRVIFPLFTRHIYADKDRQEAIIAASDLDWTIVRPAPFATRVGRSALAVVTEVAPSTRLTRVTRDEVADFVAGQIDDLRLVRQRPFIGHA